MPARDTQNYATHVQSTMPPSQKYVYVLAFRAHYTLKRKIVPIARSTLHTLFLVFASLLPMVEPFCPYKGSVVEH